MNLFYKIHLQAFNVNSIVLYHSCPTFRQVLYSVRMPSLLMHLITRVTSLDTSSVLLKRFPRNGFFNFGNNSKASGLMSGMYSGWGSTCHPYFSKISDTAPDAWGHVLMYDRWSLREIWVQSVSSSISRLSFAEQGPRSLPICTQCFWMKSGSQLSENQNDCIILLAAQSQCAELLKWPTYFESRKANFLVSWTITIYMSPWIEPWFFGYLGQQPSHYTMLPPTQFLNINRLNFSGFILYHLQCQLIYMTLMYGWPCIVVQCG